VDSAESSVPSSELSTTYDEDRDASLTSTIVQAVATVKDADPTDLDPLQTAVDPDALEGVVSSLGRPAPADREGSVEFTYEGCQVVVTSGGDVTVRRRSTDGGRATVSTEEEFQVALTRLIREAEANGVVVDGGWGCRDDSTYPTWGIEIYEVDETEQK